MEIRVRQRRRRRWTLSVAATIGLAAITGGLVVVSLRADHPRQVLAGSGSRVNTSNSTQPGGTEPDAEKAEPQAFRLVGLGAAVVLTSRGLASTSDGGRTWSDRTPPNVTARDVLGFDFTSSGSGWVVAAASPGAQGLRIFHTASQRGAWTLTTVSPSAPYGQAELAHSDDQHAWIALQLQSSSAFSNGELFRTSDSGNSWVGRELPIAGKLQFVNPTTGWLAGGAALNELFGTRDGGDTWQPQHASPPSQLAGRFALYGIPAVNGDRAFLPVTFVDSSSQSPAVVAVYQTTDGGQNWGPEFHVTLPKSEGLAVPALTDLLPDGTWIVSVPGTTTVELVDARGTMLRQMSVDPSLGAITDVAFTDRANGWALLQRNTCASGKQDCTSSSALLATTDSGATWTRLRP